MIKTLLNFLLNNKISNKKDVLLSGYRVHTHVSHPIKTHQKPNTNKYSESEAHIKNISFLKLQK